MLIATTVSILALLYFFADARFAGFFPRCPFNVITGLFCPGCGSQRAFSAALHGHLWQSAQYNLLFVLSAPLILYSALAAGVNTFSSRHFSQKLFYSPLFVKIVLAVIIVFWIARNIPQYPFNLLAPHTA